MITTSAAPPAIELDDDADREEVAEMWTPIESCAKEGASFVPSPQKRMTLCLRFREAGALCSDLT